MKRLLSLYKWELHNELFASIYFAAMLSMYSIEVLLHGERSVDIIIMLEMLIVCYVMAIIQRIIFWNDSNYSKKGLVIRTIIWFISSMLLVIVSSILFQWFSYLQPWALGAFMVYMVIFFIAIWIGIHIANNIDSKHLNNMLTHYQEKSK